MVVGVESYVNVCVLPNWAFQVGFQLLGKGSLYISKLLGYLFLELEVGIVSTLDTLLIPRFEHCPLLHIEQ